MENSVFARARTFIYRNARPLDLSRFQYHFESGSREAVIRALSFYQNEDGGCGHAVEADCWNPHSTPLHSGTAGDILREIGFDDAEHPFVRGLVSFYLSGAFFDGHHWSILAQSNNDHPHAPWWHTQSVSSAHTDYNGTAQIAGFLIRYSAAGSEGYNLGARIAREAADALLSSPLNDMHTCVCYIHMLHLMEKADALHLIDAGAVKRRLHETAAALLRRDADRWHAYACRPSNVFSSMESEFYEENRELAQRECGFIIDTQLEDGSWPITWNWERFPEAWAISKNWWKSHLIIQNLLYLKGMDRL